MIAHVHFSSVWHSAVTTLSCGCMWRPHALPAASHSCMAVSLICCYGNGSAICTSDFMFRMTKHKLFASGPLSDLIFRRKAQALCNHRHINETRQAHCGPRTLGPWLQTQCRACITVRINPSGTCGAQGRLVETPGMPPHGTKGSVEAAVPIRPAKAG